MIINNGPMNIGDIFSNGFSFASKALKRNIIISSAFIIPVGILYAFVMESYFAAEFINMLKLQTGASEIPGMESETTFISSEIFFILLSALFTLCYLAAQVGVVKIAVSEMQGESITVKQAFQFIFSKAFLRVLGLFLYVILALGGLISLPVILMSIGNYLDISIISIAAIVILVLFSGFAIYFSVLWLFSFLHLLSTNETIIGSLKYSAILVSGNWWRTFGILILTSIAAGFAIGLITTPVSFFFAGSYMSEILQLAKGQQPQLNDPKILLDMIKTIGFTVGIVVTMSYFLQTLILPVYNAAMYFDLQARKSGVAINQSKFNSQPVRGL